MNLTQREKQTIAAGAVLFGLIVAFQVFVRPAIGRLRTLRRVVSDKQQLLGELRAKSEQYKAVSRELEKIRLEMERQPEERNILSFVERIQKDSGLMQKVVYNSQGCI
jgi:type II secretory pathway component PulM